MSFTLEDSLQEVRCNQYQETKGFDLVIKGHLAQLILPMKSCNWIHFQYLSLNDLKKINEAIMQKLNEIQAVETNLGNTK